MTAHLSKPSFPFRLDDSNPDNKGLSEFDQQTSFLIGKYGAPSVKLTCSIDARFRDFRRAAQYLRERLARLGVSFPNLSEAQDIDGGRIQFELSLSNGFVSIDDLNDATPLFRMSFYDDMAKEYRHNLNLTFKYQ